MRMRRFMTQSLKEMWKTYYFGKNKRTLTCSFFKKNNFSSKLQLFSYNTLFNNKEIYFSETKQSSGAQDSPMMPSGPRAASKFLLPLPREWLPVSTARTGRWRWLWCPDCAPEGQRGRDNRRDGHPSRTQTSFGLSYFTLLYFNGSEFQKLLLYCHH